MATRPIAGMISSLFSLWRLSTCDQAALLGLAEEDLELCRAGQLAGGDIEQREGHMLAIHSALRVIFPDPSNRDLAYRCITTENRASAPGPWTWPRSPAAWPKSGGCWRQSWYVENESPPSIPDGGLCTPSQRETPRFFELKYHLPFLPTPPRRGTPLVFLALPYPSPGAGRRCAAARGPGRPAVRERADPGPVPPAARPDGGPGRGPWRGSFHPTRRPAAGALR